MSRADDWGGIGWHGLRAAALAGLAWGACAVASALAQAGPPLPPVPDMPTGSPPSGGDGDYGGSDGGWTYLCSRVDVGGRGECAVSTLARAVRRVTRSGKGKIVLHRSVDGQGVIVDRPVTITSSNPSLFPQVLCGLTIDLNRRRNPSNNLEVTINGLHFVSNAPSGPCIQVVSGNLVVGNTQFDANYGEPTFIAMLSGRLHIGKSKDAPDGVEMYGPGQLGQARPQGTGIFVGENATAELFGPIKISGLNVGIDIGGTIANLWPPGASSAQEESPSPRPPGDAFLMIGDNIRLCDNSVGVRVTSASSGDQLINRFERAAITLRGAQLDGNGTGVEVEDTFAGDLQIQNIAISRLEGGGCYLGRQPASFAEFIGVDVHNYNERGRVMLHNSTIDGGLAGLGPSFGVRTRNSIDVEASTIANTHIGVLLGGASAFGPIGLTVTSDQVPRAYLQPPIFKLNVKFGGNYYDMQIDDNVDGSLVLSASNVWSCDDGQWRQRFSGLFGSSCKSVDVNARKRNHRDRICITPGLTGLPKGLDSVRTCRRS